MAGFKPILRSPDERAPVAHPAPAIRPDVRADPRRRGRHHPATACRPRGHPGHHLARLRACGARQEPRPAGRRTDGGRRASAGAGAWRVRASRQLSRDAAPVDQPRRRAGRRGIDAARPGAEDRRGRRRTPAGQRGTYHAGFRDGQRPGVRGGDTEGLRAQPGDAVEDHRSRARRQEGAVGRDARRRTRVRGARRRKRDAEESRRPSGHAHPRRALLHLRALPARAVFRQARRGAGVAGTAGLAGRADRPEGPAERLAR